VGETTITVAKTDGGTDLILRRPQAGAGVELGPLTVTGDVAAVCLDAEHAEYATLDIPAAG
jgi:hypothetical protein